MSTPEEQWQITEALVYSVDWVDPSRNDWGHYDVTYSYKVGTDRYTGSFRDYSNEQATPLHRDDKITIRYCPEHLARSYYPEAKHRISKAALFLGIGASAGLVALLVLYLTNSSH